METESASARGQAWSLTSGCLVTLWNAPVLLVGDSGLGKTDLMLDLADRGHRWLADDVVEVRQQHQGVEVRCPLASRRLTAVRGLGLIRHDVAESSAPVMLALVVELVCPNTQEWAAWPRLEPVWRSRVLGPGITVQALALPVAPGRPMALLIEYSVKTLVPALPPCSGISCAIQESLSHV